MAADIKGPDALGFYRGSEEPSRHLSERDPPITDVLEATGSYIPDVALVRAVNVSVLLGMPLLLTGDPGVGKTRLASHLAEMQKAPFEKFVVTSTTLARDLLYSFDDLARLRDAYRTSTDDQDIRRYLRFNALGIAILRACGPEAALQQIAATADIDAEPGTGSAVWSRLGQRRSLDGPPPKASDIFNFHADVEASRRRDRDPLRPTVVLVDEIDKAPRELPNDLLTALDRFEFDIPELGLRVAPPRGSERPVLVVTSNRETALPDPFLRRCCYHHIDFPDDDALAAIVAGHLDAPTSEGPSSGGSSVSQSAARSTFRAEALSFVRELRDSGRMIRPPGLAEIIEWHVLVERRLLPDRAPSSLADPRLADLLPMTLSVLLKTPEDLQAGNELLRDRPGRAVPA